jgi:hypothetical protein
LIHCHHQSTFEVLPFLVILCTLLKTRKNVIIKRTGQCEAPSFLKCCICTDSHSTCCCTYCFHFICSLTGLVLCLAFWHTLNSFSLLFLYGKNGNIKCPVHVIQVFLNFEQHMLYTHVWKIFHFTANTACVYFIGTTGKGWRREKTVEFEQWWGTGHWLSAVICEIWQVKAKLKWKVKITVQVNMENFARLWISFLCIVFYPCNI